MIVTKLQLCRHLPDVDDVLARSDRDTFDYAAVIASMLQCDGFHPP